MRKLLILLAVVPTLLAAACGDSTSSSTTTTAATTSSTASGAGGGAPSIEEFEIAGDVKCTSGQETTVKAKWTTKNATKTRLEVDGKFLKEDGPPTGDHEVPLACDDKSHRVVLEALDAEGKNASAAHSVKTEPGGGSGGTKPVIDEFSVSVKGCSPQIAEVLATWKTEHADKIAFAVDGKEQAGLSGQPAHGTVVVPDIPCDGKTHSVTITASGSGGTAHKSVTITTPLSG